MTKKAEVAQSVLDDMNDKIAKMDEMRSKTIEALMDLILFVPEWVPFSTKEDEDENPFYCQGDEYSPWLSEGYLYNLLGKEDGRSVLVRIYGLSDALGIDRLDFFELWHEEFEKRWRGGVSIQLEKAADAKEARIGLEEAVPDIVGYLWYHTAKNQLYTREIKRDLFVQIDDYCDREGLELKVDYAHFRPDNPFR